MSETEDRIPTQVARDIAFAIDALIKANDIAADVPLSEHSRNLTRAARDVLAERIDAGLFPWLAGPLVDIPPIEVPNPIEVRRDPRGKVLAVIEHLPDGSAEYLLIGDAHRTREPLPDPGDDAGWDRFMGRIRSRADWLRYYRNETRRLRARARSLETQLAAAQRERDQAFDIAHAAIQTLPA
jgi:hypothetical protein